MPVVGWTLGSLAAAYIRDYDHWIAFGLLLFVGGKAIYEALSDGDGEGEERRDPTRGWNLLLLSVATSIDALAVGITFAFLQVRIVPAVCLIGAITFLLSGAGIKIGNVFGAKYRCKAELAGGIVLILMGLKILLEHLRIL